MRVFDRHSRRGQRFFFKIQFTDLCSSRFLSQQNYSSQGKFTAKEQIFCMRRYIFLFEDNLVFEMVDVYFDDVIKIDRLDPDGKKFDKVSRIEAHSEEYDMHIQLDVNTEVYPIHVGEKFRVALAPTLNLDGSAVTSYIPEGSSKSLADKFEYIMHGLLYKMSDDESSGTVKVIAYISFGGLQLMLKGDPTHMGKFKLDQRLFLLMRKM